VAQRGLRRAPTSFIYGLPSLWQRRLAQDQAYDAELFEPGRPQKKKVLSEFGWLMQGVPTFAG